MLLERVKWTTANIGWPTAFVFWFQVIVVLFTATDGRIGPLALGFFHFLWIIIVCSFFSASFTPPVRYSQEETPETDSDGFCEKCEKRKPARWHHCRRCNQCVRRMDHHCPILQMCVHSENHKYFMLFLLWPLQLAIFTLFHGYSDFWKMICALFTGHELNAAEQIKGTGVSNALMVAFAAIYLLREQLPNLLRNQTLIEDSRGITEYDLGSWHENVKSVMGPWKWAWLPVGLAAKTKKMV